MRGSKETRAAVEPRRIPSELDEFLRRDAFSLAIKGKAGTGKTTLALTILSLVMKGQNCLYLSTRLATSELFEYHPWIQHYLVDSENRETEEGEPPIDTAPFVDARLDEPSTLFERITNELMDTNSPMIIVDTWDAVGDFMDNEALMNNAKILQVWRQRARAKLVFVIENVEDKTFDNLVDGVIELEERYIDSRKTRRIHLSKLRGIKIKRPWNFFTLNQGVFHSFEPFNVETAAHDSRQTPRMVLNEGDDPTDNNVSTLSEVMEGLIPSHSRIILEPDPIVNPKAPFVLLAGIISNYLRKNNSAILLPLTSVSYDFVDSLLKSWVPDSNRQRLAVVRFVGSTADANLKSTVMMETIKKSVNKVKHQNPKTKVLGIMSVGPVSEIARIDLQDLETAISANCDSSLVVVVPDPRISEKLSPVADIRLKMRDVEGTLFIQPESPWASFYAFENNKDAPGTIVEPMV